MPNGHEVGRWLPDDELRQHPSHSHPHGRNFPNFIPAQVVIPSHRGFWSYVGRSFFLLTAIVVVFLIVIPWVVALLSLLWAPMKEAPSSTVSFFEGVHPFIREWLPTWTVGAIAGLTIGALVRILRKI